MRTGVGPRFSAAARAASDLPSRKNIRLPAENNVGRRLYFVTICFYRRKRFGANPKAAAWLASTLRSIAVAKSFLIHAWCILPDHLHILAEGTAETSDLLSFIGEFKQHTAFQFARRMEWTPPWKEKAGCRAEARPYIKAREAR